MLKRLKIHRFRHVAPGTELEFSDRYNVLLGKNGTGKTTLLDLISMVLRSDFSSLRSEEFDIEYEVEREAEFLRVRFINHQQTLREGKKRGGRVPVTFAYTPKVHVGLQGYVNEREHRNEVIVDGASLRWSANGEQVDAGVPIDVFQGSFIKEMMRALPLSNDSIDVRSHLNKYSESWTCAYRFDESLGVFESITGQNGSNSRKSPNIPHIGVVHGFGTKIPWYGSPGDAFFPYDYVPVRPEIGQSSVKVNLPAESALHNFPHLAGFRAMVMSLAVEGNSTHDDVIWWQFGRAEFLFEVPNAMFNHDDLSYGQKRLLAFLYYLDVNEHYVVADELVNGMHHDWVKACLELMGTRQAFLTSQNPLLLDYLPLESVEQVQRSFIQCKVRTSDKKSEFVWSNLDTDDATQLLADYEVGIQHVGELLRVRGLW